ESDVPQGPFVAREPLPGPLEGAPAVRYIPTPEEAAVVCADRPHYFAVGGECQLPGRTRLRQFHHPLVVLHVPHLEDAVLVARDEPAAVGVVGEAGYQSVVPAEDAVLSPGPQIPDAHGLVGAGAGDEPVFRRTVRRPIRQRGPAHVMNVA